MQYRIHFLKISKVKYFIYILIPFIFLFIKIGDKGDNTRNSHVIPKSDIYAEQRRKRQMENKAWSLIKKIFVYMIYLLVLFNVCYSKTDRKSYHYQRRLSELIVPDINEVNT